MIENITFIFPYDYILLIITSLFIFVAIWKGLIQSILGLLTWIGSIIITLYTYNTFSDFITKQILKVNFFQNFEFISNIIGIIISIPIIFIVSLFILKKIRKFLSSDLDKQIFGIILDKFFGLIYGIIFSYIIFSSLLYGLNKFKLDDLNIWLIENSNILFIINEINEEYLYDFIPKKEEI